GGISRSDPFFEIAVNGIVHWRRMPSMPMHLTVKIAHIETEQQNCGCPELRCQVHHLKTRMATAADLACLGHEDLMPILILVSLANADFLDLRKIAHHFIILRDL